MYKLIAETEFDSAHFLKGYPGKCANIHGHRWRVVCELSSDKLQSAGPEKGMVMDFSALKGALKHITEPLDHKLLFEAGTLRQSTAAALTDEGFELFELHFTPTAENMAKYFFDGMKHAGLSVCQITVYETPNNAAAYSEKGVRN